MDPLCALKGLIEERYGEISRWLGGCSLWQCMKAGERETGPEVGRQVVFWCFVLFVQCLLEPTEGRLYAGVTKQRDNTMGKIRSRYLGIQTHAHNSDLKWGRV